MKTDSKRYVENKKSKFLICCWVTLLSYQNLIFLAFSKFYFLEFSSSNKFVLFLSYLSKNKTHSCT